MEYLFLIFSIRGELIKMPLDEILYIESKGKKVHLGCLGAEHEYYGRMKETFMELDERFFKCHEWLSINLDHVLRISDQKIFFANGEKKYIGIHNYYKVKKAYKYYMEKQLVNCISKKHDQIEEYTKYN